MIVLSDSQYYSDIANAIRAKNGESTQYKPSEMALAIKSLQGGGINCTLTISTVPNATVTATFENQTVTAIADVNGTAILELSKEGVWTVTANLEGETTTKLIDTSFSITTELSFVDPILANNTWEQISKVARSGNASKYWNVGDTKSFTIGAVTYTAQIMDFDIYDVSDPTSYGREKAGIVFQPIEVINNKQSWNNAKTYANSEIADNAECKDFVPTIKYEIAASYNSSATVETAKGILPSEIEIFGTNSYDTILSGKQYAFYAAGNSKIKKVVGSSTTAEWWLRSTAKTGTYRCYVNTSGSLARSSSSRYYAPVFCI